MKFPHLDRRRLRALIRKEQAQIRRDVSTFLIAFAMPLLLLFLFGYAISLDTSRTRVALVMEDSSAQALGLAQAYRNSPYFAASMARNVESVRDSMIEGEVRAIIVIPADFGVQMEKGRHPAIQVITDGSEPNTANFVAAYARGVQQSWVASLATGRKAEERSAAPIEISQRVWFNPELRSRNFLVPGSITIVMTMIGTLLTALVVAREWERGTMEAMMATPITMAEFIASKIIPYFLLGMAAMAVCTAIAVTVFHVPLRGSVLTLAAIAAAFLMPSLGLGLFISATTKNQFVASQIALMSAFLPTFLLSGFIYEIASMPVPIQAITYAVPARYLIPALQTVFLAGDLWGVILPNIAIMLGFGVLFFLLAYRATRRSLDR
ncbi:MAG: ABC transporter permease [Sphingobium sp.]